jgi:peptidoglycan hydrolase-like protein with peptidoglycan-binding domain
MKKTSQNNPTPTPTVTTPPTPTPAAPPRRTPDQPQNRSNAIKLSDIKNGTKIVKIGSKGSVVTKIQELLIGLGYNDVSNSGKADAYFGPKTDAMVKKYQKDNGLKDDGIVGSKTIIALLGGKSDATKVEPVVTATQPDNIQGTDGVIIKEKEKLDILQESVKKLLRKSLLGFRKK